MKLLKFLSITLAAITISQNSYASRNYVALDYLDSDVEFEQYGGIFSAKDDELVNKSSSPHGLGIEVGTTFGGIFILNPHIFGAIRDANLHYREQNPGVIFREAGIDEHMVSIGNSVGLGVDLGIGNYKYAYFYIGGDLRYTQIDYQIQKYIGDATQTPVITSSDYQAGYAVAFGLVARLTRNLNLKIEFETETYEAYDILSGDQLIKNSLDSINLRSTKIGVRYLF